MEFPLSSRSRRGGLGRLWQSKRGQTTESCCLANKANYPGISLEGSSVLKRTTTKINSQYVHVYVNRGISFKTSSQDKEALKCCDRAIEVNPSCGEAYNSKGLSLQKFGRNQTALECYDRALELEPQTPLFAVNKAILLNRMGQRQKAIHTFKSAYHLVENLVSNLDMEVKTIVPVC
eukprot:gb/GECG01002390.1/.p1 GENE.gb/GECG01002390.1/~~gb/GECG01002390.1/.p1  ORF type:complete len:177 (+),score=13.81 gb/GECG01002390.1/:1-531(+)